jgi:carbon storage regulator
MLVLTRRVGEEIVIDSEIRVTVVAVNGRRVRLGITAPSSVSVARMELLMGCAANAPAETSTKEPCETGA